MEKETNHHALKSNNIILLGVTGCGKSTSGWLLAKLLGYGFLDLDFWIEKRRSKSISDIFKDKGEVEFRKMESESLRELSGVRHHVIALGGGSIQSEENWEFVQNLGRTVWLKCPPLEIAKRLLMKPDEIRKRPMISDLVGVSDKEQRLSLLTQTLDELLLKRKPRYEEADFVLDCAHATRDVAAHLLCDLVLGRIND